MTKERDISNFIKFIDYEDKRLYINEKNGKWKFLHHSKIEDCNNPLDDNTINHLDKTLFFDEKEKSEIPINNKHIILKVTDDCNLNCTYCFQGEKKQKNHLTFESNSKIIHILKSYAMQDSKMTYSIEFTGGEPLLFPNIIEDFIIKTKNSQLKISRYAIKTNGTIYTKKIENMIKKYSVGLCLSIDGDEKYHNKNRLSKSGNKTFDSIMKNIINFNYPFTNIAVAYDVDQFDGIFKLFETKNIIGQRINPVIFDENHSTVDQEELAKKQFELYKRIIDLYANNDNFYHLVSIREMLSRILNPQGLNQFSKVCPSRNCNAGFKMISIDPLLDVFPCMEIANIKNSKIGNIEESNILDKIFNGSKVCFVEKMNNFDIEECNNCTFRIFCRGGCPSRTFTKYNNFKKVSDSCKYTYEMYKLLFSLFTTQNDTQKVISYLNKCNSNKVKQQIGV